MLGAAQEIGADYLVVSSFSRSSDAIRVNCELNDVHKGVIVGSWSRNLIDVSKDLYPSIDQFADEIAEALGAKWQEGAERANVALTESIEALKYYQYALDRIEAGNFPEAVEQLELAVEADSTFAAAYLPLARLHTDGDRQEVALQRAMIYRHGAPPPIDRLILASQLEWDHQVNDAIAMFQSVLADYPEDVEARVSLAKLFMVKRRFGDAAAEFAVIKTLNPFDFSYYARWSTVYAEMGRMDRALAVLEKWREKQPEGPAPLRTLVSHHYTFGNYAAMEKALDALVELSPDADLTYRGSLYIDLGRVEEARRLFVRLVTSPSVHFVAGRGYTRLARLCYMTGEYENGQMWIEKALDVSQDYYNFWIAGLLAAVSGRSEQARKYAAMIKMDFSDMEQAENSAFGWGIRRFYYNLLGEVALAEGDTSRGVEMHERVKQFCIRTDRPFLAHFLDVRSSPQGILTTRFPNSRMSF